MSIKFAVAVAASASFVGSATADDLLIIDLTTPNSITISATTGLSAVTASGSDGTGVLFENFFNTNAFGGFADTAGVGDLTNVGNPSDGTPGIFRTSAAGLNNGLNFWTWSSDITVDFTAGTQAFTGSATWTVDPVLYGDLLAGNTSGDIYFPADSDDDIAGAVALGTYRVIPAPASAALLGLGGLAAVRRRR